MNRPVPGSKPEDLGAPTRPLLTKVLFSYVNVCVAHCGSKTVLIHFSWTHFPTFRNAFPMIAPSGGLRCVSAVAAAIGWFQGEPGVAGAVVVSPGLFRAESGAAYVAAVVYDSYHYVLSDAVCVASSAVVHSSYYVQHKPGSAAADLSAEYGHDWTMQCSWSCYVLRLCFACES